VKGSADIVRLRKHFTIGNIIIVRIGERPVSSDFDVGIISKVVVFRMPKYLVCTHILRQAHRPAFISTLQILRSGVVGFICLRKVRSKTIIVLSGKVIRVGSIPCDIDGVREILALCLPIQPV
jgi:hypothetical protein